MKLQILWGLLLSVALILMIIGIGYIINKEQKELEEDISCYYIHILECMKCHDKNLTYALCSGFCVEQSKEDKEIFCAFNPQENCKDIPKECLI